MPRTSRFPASKLMVQGCTSDAGKTVLVAALCRILARRGFKVAPFKPQNMALNSAVTIDGGEIGRAQALQALAAGVAAHTDFNPILLKPETDKRAQIIVHGKALLDLDACAYHEYKPRAMKAVLESWQRLTDTYDFVVVEGAGSPAEINLRDRDIANMGFAEAVNCPVILIADIDRGGVFAHLVGTLELLSVSEQALVKGFVINRFRGDPALLESGLRWLEERTGKPVLAVIPYLHGLYLDAEDGLSRDKVHANTEPQRLRVIAPAYPRIANHNDLDPLRFHPDVDFSWVGPHDAVPPCDLIVLPGSKSVQADLAWLKEMGWEAALHKHVRYGGKLIGICGGLQMLGRALHDPHGLEGAPGTSAGFGFFDYETTLSATKTLENVEGTLTFAEHAPITGYRIHQGVTTGASLLRPALTLEMKGSLDGEKQAEGALSDDGQILATYCHGVFDTPEALNALLNWAGKATEITFDAKARREKDLDRLADSVEEAMHWPLLEEWFSIKA